MSMISSADGAVSIAGTSGGLGGPADRAVFRHLRSISDGVIVGAETVRREGYSPLPALQTLAVMSKSGNLGTTTRELMDAGNTLLVQGDVADVCASLSGQTWILEGGPNLNAQMLAAGCVDEICLTISPVVVSGDSSRIVAGDAGLASNWHLAHIAHDQGFVFLRYLSDSSN